MSSSFHPGGRLTRWTSADIRIPGSPQHYTERRDILEPHQPFIALYYFLHSLIFPVVL